MSKNEDTSKASFVSHLSELRQRLLKSFIFLFFTFIISYIFSEEIYKFLVKPYSEAILENNLDRRLIFTALHEAFLTYLSSFFYLNIFNKSYFFDTNMEICSTWSLQ